MNVLGVIVLILNGQLAGAHTAAVFHDLQTCVDNMPRVIMAKGIDKSVPADTKITFFCADLNADIARMEKSK